MVRSIVLALALLSLSVVVHSFVVDFGAASQCNTVQIAWTEFSTLSGKLEFPLTLHIIPLNSTAVTQRMDGWNSSMDSGSLNVDFNFPGGTPYLLGITDAAGVGMGHTSEIRNATSSSDASCLSNSTATQGLFELDTTPSSLDCPSITVTWNSTSINRPTLLAFSPGRVPVNLLTEGRGTLSHGQATVEGIFTSLSKVVVLFNDGVNPPQTSDQKMVGGKDRNICSSNAVAILDSFPNMRPGTTPGLVIGYISGSIVITVILVILIVRYQKNRLQTQSQSTPVHSPPEPPVFEEKEKAKPIEDAVPAEPDRNSSAPSQRYNSSAPSQRTSSVDLDAVPVQAHKLRHTMGVIVTPKAGVTGGIPTSRHPPAPLNLPLAPPPPEVYISKSPLSARRRSVATSSSRRPSNTTETDESYFLLIAGVPTPVPVPPFGPSETRPDSPTIPDSSPNSAPSTPKSAGSRPKSQRSEKRSQYLRLNASADALPLETSRKSPGILATRASARASYIKKRS